MTQGSQDPIVAIETALVALRRGGFGRRGPEHSDERGGPTGEHRPPWGDGPPPARMRGHHGHGRDGSLAGAARFRLLDALMRADPSQRMGISEIADAIHVDQPRASRLVNEAAERGLVTRRADERDARRSVVELTEAGLAFLESANASRRSAVTSALAEFTPEEVAAFSTLLSRFVDAWRRQ